MTLLRVLSTVQQRWPRIRGAGVAFTAVSAFFFQTQCQANFWLANFLTSWHMHTHRVRTFIICDSVPVRIFQNSVHVQPQFKRVCKYKVQFQMRSKKYEKCIVFTTKCPIFSLTQSKSSLDSKFLRDLYSGSNWSMCDPVVFTHLQCGLHPRTSGRMDCDIIDVNFAPDESGKESSYFHAHGSHL